MSNYSMRVDLKKVRGAFVCRIQGNTTAKACLCIPLDSEDIFAGDKGVYLDLNAYETQQSQYGDTHMLRVRLNKERYNTLTEEQRRAVPIVGNMRPMQGEVERQAEAAPMAVAAKLNDEDDDLPY